MSRCFTFPPPGYEKKARTGDTDLLKKEKHREKKEEKKNKEKREKERREKDRSDGKHRDKKEKKDRKEKRGDKKEKEKDRDKDKVKDKSNTSDEKNNTGQSEIYNAEKLNHKRRESDEDKSSISNEKEQGHYGEKANQNTLLEWRIRDDKNGIGSQFVDSLRDTEQKIDARMDKLVGDTGILAEGKQNGLGKRVDDRKIDGQARSLGKSTERRMEEENSKEVEGNRKRGDKQKDRDKKSHGKDKDREKDKKRVEKSENKSEDQDKFKDRIKNDLFGAQNITTSHALKNGDRDTGTEENLKKRKEFESNGFLHETAIRPSKMPRPSPHPSTENGRKLVPCRTPIVSTSDRMGPPNNLKVDSKERKVNGLIEAHSLSLSSEKSSALSQADQIAQASMKPPHPDSKYLSHIFSIPKMKEWSNFDDQEWLFSSRKYCPLEKPDVGSSEMPRVWAEALQIESADVCALPYVIPY